MIKRADDHATNIETALHFDNLVLYRMCECEPLHRDKRIVEGKVRAIERIYAASTARGAGKAAADAEPVARWIAKSLCSEASDIDARLKAIRDSGVLGSSFVTLECLKLHDDICDWIVSATRRWREEHGIKGGEKKDGTEAAPRRHVSFASKYLHFHAPNAFPIYDRFARLALENELPSDGYRYDQDYEHFTHAMVELAKREGFAGLTVRGLDAKLVQKGRTLQAKRDQKAGKGKLGD